MTDVLVWTSLTSKDAKEIIFSIIANMVTVVHSTVFTGHLVYSCIAVTLIFRNENSLIMRQKLTLLKNPGVYYRNIRENIIRLFLLNVWPLKMWKHINIWQELAKNRKNNVYKNGNKIAIFHVF